MLREGKYQSTGDWYHGSPSGDLRGGTTGLHLGTFLAAKQALEARIGIKADGTEWDGTTEYGKTLLAGKNTLKKRGIGCTGFNCDVPDEDFYPTDNMLPKYSDGTHMKLTDKPSIKKYKITCYMNNTPQNPYPDFKANGYMKASLKRGRAVNGFFYKNEGEDFGSISAVVPNGNCVKEV